MGLWTIDSWTKIALPIGISFFTFQSLSYTIDVYRREERPLQSPFHYFIYIFSFPQMIAGPIVRFGVVAKELISREFNRKGIEEGAQRFIIGLAKKVIVANGIAASFPITGVEEWSTAGAWFALWPTPSRFTLIFPPFRHGLWLRPNHGIPFSREFQPTL